MAIDYEKLQNKLPRDVWFTGPQLSQLWKLKDHVRKARANAMYHKGMLVRRGMTANVQYKLADVTDAPAYKPVKDKPNPNLPNSLDSLIAAASKVGTENEILKTALQEAKAAIERAFEAIQ